MATRDAVKRNVTKSLLAMSLLGLASEPVHASGFALRESSASAMGTSYAGAAVVDVDPSYLVYNPASLANVREWDTSFNVTGLLLDSRGVFAATTTIGTPTGGESTPHGFVGDALVPAFSARYRLNDRWAIGAAFSAPWGESTSYPATWVGRYYAIGTSLVSYDLTPVVSFQVSPQLTLAAGAQIQYLRSHLTEAIDFGTLGALNHIPGAVPGAQDGQADLHGHSWGAGYVLGVRWQVAPAVALGISYRSEIHQALKGTERFVYDGAGIAATINSFTGAFTQSAGHAELPTPAVLTAGVQWGVDDRWTLLGGVEFTNWSSLHQLLIQSDNPANPSAVTMLNWKDTWFGSLGAEYRADARWTLRAGTAFDEAAAPRQTLEPRIPDANRYWISAGAGYQWSDNVDLNFAASYLFAPTSAIHQTVSQTGNLLRGNLDGASSTRATLITAQIVFH